VQRERERERDEKQFKLGACSIFIKEETGNVPATHGDGVCTLDEIRREFMEDFFQTNN
jgi:hypothetical protein